MIDNDFMEDIIMNKEENKFKNFKIYLVFCCYDMRSV